MAPPAARSTSTAPEQDTAQQTVAAQQTAPGQGASDTTTPEFLAAWQQWRHARLGAVSDPLGVASLVSTTWLAEGAHVEVDGVAGRWRADGPCVVGTGLAGSGYTGEDGVAVDDTVRLDAQSVLIAGVRRLRIHLREGSPALRVFDAASPGLTNLQGIATYEPDAAWVVPARFEAGGAPRQISLVDGYTLTEQPAGAFVFTLEGQEHRLTVRRAGQAYSAVFGDATNGTETYRFRFLRIKAPDETGRGEIDFTRAFLPPCAFSDQYVCPLPPPGNRLTVPVRAGERTVLRRDS